ncbi:hypothetical protein SNE40_000234 [Patella caerulea]|uniref:Uncharacterized protein n=1 Tax=Patella caerulea TaxID=87958 RepID=A0AAN8KA37_PATCE
MASQNISILCFMLFVILNILGQNPYGSRTRDPYVQTVDDGFTQLIHRDSLEDGNVNIDLGDAINQSTGFFRGMLMDLYCQRCRTDPCRRRYCVTSNMVA